MSADSEDFLALPDDVQRDLIFLLRGLEILISRGATRSWTYSHHRDQVIWLLANYNYLFLAAAELSYHWEWVAGPAPQLEMLVEDEEALWCVAETEYNSAESDSELDDDDWQDVF